MGEWTGCGPCAAGDERYKALIEGEIRRAEEHFERAAKGLPMLAPAARLPVLAAGEIYGMGGGGGGLVVRSFARLKHGVQPRVSKLLTKHCLHCYNIDPTCKSPLVERLFHRERVKNSES